MNKHLILIIIFLITIIYYNIFNKNIIEKHTSLNPIILSSNFNNDNLDGSEFSFQTISGV